MAKKKKVEVKDVTDDTVKSASSGKRAVEIAMKSIRKKFGDEVVSWVSEVPSSKRDVISTTSLSIDAALGIGGIARGRIYEFYGPNACLDSETHIPYAVVDKEGKAVNHKGVTIEHLYERFHGVTRPGKGYYQRQSTIGAGFYTTSVNDEGMLFRNKIIDVVSTGVKECFELKTKNGRAIVATEDHKFSVGGSYLPLKELTVGSAVMVRGDTWNKYVTKQKTKSYRKFWYVKNHPVAGTKKINSKSSGTSYTYKRLAQSRAVVEAEMNGMCVESYRNHLNSGDITGLKFLQIDQHVHHIDDNFTNDSLSNLAVISSPEHTKLYLEDKKLGRLVEEDVVTSITCVGKRTTYDIKMEAPYNNYVANNMVVHNSGKTTLALLVIKEAIRLGQRAVFIDAEHTLDPGLLKAMEIDTDKIVITRGYTGEDNLDIAERLMATGEFAVCVIDSVSALQPAAEANLESFSDQTMGLQPRLMSRMCRTFTSLASRTNTALILINQIRANIGGYGNPETTSGGNAIQHHVTCRVRIIGGGVKSRQIRDAAGEVMGHRCGVQITKNKLAAPFRSAEVELIYGKGFNVDGEILDLGVDMGFIDQAGSYFKVDDVMIGQGRVKAIAEINSNNALREDLLHKIKTLLGIDNDTPQDEVLPVEKDTEIKIE